MTTKEKVLQRLAQAQGQPVSGETLATECGVSRAAIWKAVSTLRTEGCQIEGTPNGGYVLGDDDVFTQEIFAETFSTCFPEFSNCHIKCFKEIDSTNTYAKRVLAECGNLRNADGSLTPAGEKYNRSIFVAEKQTAGRGRMGRTFVSPDKTGIYISVVYAPAGGIKDPARITVCTAVAVCRTLKKLYGGCGVQPQIKWINDIFAGGKKICGILAEGVANFESGMIESAVIGIGINVKSSSAFSGKLADIAGSLEEVMKDSKNAQVSRVRLAAEVAGQVFSILEEDAESAASHARIISEYKEASFLLGQKITVFPLIGYDKSSYKAVATDIDENAGLVVTLADGTTRTLQTGEVSLKSDEFVT